MFGLCGRLDSVLNPSDDYVTRCARCQTFRYADCGMGTFINEEYVCIRCLMMEDPKVLEEWKESHFREMERRESWKNSKN